MSENMNLRAYDSLDRPPVEEETTRKGVLPIVVLAQIFGVMAVIMCIVWLGNYYGGFDWQNPDLIFNYHPIFMILGLMFCFGDAMLVYRVFHTCPKLALKAVHGVLMILSLLFSVIGLKAVFDSHSARGIPHLYSIHSWIGLVTVVIFALQWVVGLTIFLVPSIPVRVRSKILPLHTAFGLYLFCCALVVCISGITEKNFFTPGRQEHHTVSNEFPFQLKYITLPIPAMLSNFMGLCLAVFSAMVFYLVHRSDYRRVEPINTEQVGFRALN